MWSLRLNIYNTARTLRPLALHGCYDCHSLRASLTCLGSIHTYLQVNPDAISFVPTLPYTPAGGQHFVDIYMCMHERVIAFPCRPISNTNQMREDGIGLIILRGRAACGRAQLKKGTEVIDQIRSSRRALPPIYLSLPSHSVDLSYGRTREKEGPA